MTIFEETQYLCKQYGLHPQRRSGQNFLIREEIFDAILDAAELKKSDNILEIGPGFGMLTRRLAEWVHRVWAVELEQRFIPVLRALSKHHPSIDVIQGDILKINLPTMIRDRPYKVVANLPYNITSIFLRNILEIGPRPAMLVLLLQKEVAERITARRGEMSLLAVSVQYYGDPNILQWVGNENFWPRPKVTSALVKITTRHLPPKPDLFTDKEFFRVVRAGFSAKRKQIYHNLSNSFHVESKKIKNILIDLTLDPRLRSQDLTLEDWKKLTLAMKIECLTQRIQNDIIK